MAAAVLLGLSTYFSVAQAADAPATAIDTGSTAWVLVASALVLFMTLPGLALFYGGLVRARNFLSVLMHCFAITCIVSVLWAAFGYSLAFDKGNPWIGSLADAFLPGLATRAMPNGLPEAAFVLFQMTFAVITPGLIIGAFVERARFSFVAVFSALWLIIVYIPVTHWVWGGGWLAMEGTIDFAGGIVVHTTAGVSALVTAMMIGARNGFPHRLNPPHSPGMTMAGAGMLWVGWFGFNGGSALAANASAASAILATHFAASAAALTWMTIEWLRIGKPTSVGLVTGCVAGLATITPASGFVGPAGALAMGVAAGVICYCGAVFVKHMFGYDDALDVFGVHAIGGATGAILTGVFAISEYGGTSGLIEGNAGQVINQIEGVLIIVVYDVIVSLILLKIIDIVIGLRVDAEIEQDGLDLALHGETVQ
jgi:Amt family ammonium transporter